MEFSDVRILRAKFFSEMDRLSNGVFARNSNISDYDLQSDMYGNLFSCTIGDRHIQVDVNWEPDSGADFRFDTAGPFGEKEALLVWIPQTDIDYRAVYDLFSDWSLRRLGKGEVIKRHKASFDPSRKRGVSP